MIGTPWRAAGQRVSVFRSRRAIAADGEPRDDARGLSTFESLRTYRNFRLYFAGQIVSFSGSNVQDTALPWMVLQLTHSPVAVGTLVFCRYGPFIIGGLYGGVIADQFDTRIVLICTQVFSMVVAALLAVLAFSGDAQLWEIYVLATCTGIQLVFDNPARWAFVYRLVDRNDVRNAVALIMGLQNTARIVGPAIGGVLIAAVGIGWCFVFNTASFVAVLAALLLIRVAELYNVERAEVQQQPLLALREAFAFVRTSVDLRIVMGMGAVFGFFGFSAVRTLISVFANQTLHGGAELFGVLFASYGAGAVGGALLTAAVPRSSRRNLFLGGLCFCTPMLCLAIVPNASVAVVLFFAIGFGWSTWSAQGMAQVQLASPDGLRGRIISLYTYTLLATAPFGGLFGGWLASVGGTALAFGVSGAAGVAMVVLSAVVLLRRRRSAADGAVIDVTPSLPDEVLG